jgi:hypothetical protein
MVEGAKLVLGISLVVRLSWILGILFYYDLLGAISVMLKF